MLECPKAASCSAGCVLRRSGVARPDWARSETLGNSRKALQQCPRRDVPPPPPHRPLHPASPKNDPSPPSLPAKRGQIGGWEFATLSFPCRHWAPRWAAGFPTPFPASLRRSLRPHSRAVPPLTGQNLLRRASGLAAASVRTASPQTRPRSDCKQPPLHGPSPIRPAAAPRTTAQPNATGLASCLSGCLWLAVQRRPHPNSAAPRKIPP